MILKKLISEIKRTMNNYVSKFSSYGEVPAQRKKDIERINRLLRHPNPIVICQRVADYLENIKTPILSWLTFIDSNNFYWQIKSILKKEEYLEINLLKSLVHEKEIFLAEYKKVVVKDDIKETFSQLTQEIKLLRGENKYLYQTLIELDKKIISLESQSKENAMRAVAAERELKYLREKNEASQPREKKIKNNPKVLSRRHSLS